MTAEGRAESAAEGIARAHEELQGADALLREGLPRIALTRAYYAVFHAVRALLHAEGHEPRTHRGALDLFWRHFVKTGRWDVETSALVSRLQRYREDADYSESFVVDAGLAGRHVEAARRFVERASAGLRATERTGPQG